MLRVDAQVARQGHGGRVFSKRVVLHSPKPARKVGGDRSVRSSQNVKSEGFTESTCIGDIVIRYSSCLKDHCSLLFLPLLYNVIHETLVLE